MSRHRTVLGAMLLLVVALGLAGAPLEARVARAGGPQVNAVRVKGAINAVTANFVSRALGQAAEAQAEAVIIELDTPGGFDTAMRDIIQRISASPVPVVVFVAPSGARAASAGTFVTLAGHVAAMAPNTAIGAAHPVDASGADIEGTMAEKVTNDAAAYIRGIAAARGRNADWAERAVRESISASDGEALEAGVIDLVAPDVETLLERLDGRRVTTAAGERTLRTAGAQVVDTEMNFVEDFLSLLSDPTIAYVLVTLGMLGLFFELSNPGAILPGVVGGICLLLGLYSLGSLPINWAGALLIGLAFVLFIAEVKITSHGLLTVAGVICMTIGSLMLINRASAPYLEISRPVIGVVVLLTAGFFTFAVTAVIRVRRRRVVTGREGLIGQVGTARTPLNPEGMVLVVGETWEAKAVEGDIPAGEKVVVTNVKGLTLTVRRMGT